MRNMKLTKIVLKKTRKQKIEKILYLKRQMKRFKNLRSYLIKMMKKYKTRSRKFKLNLSQHGVGVMVQKTMKMRVMIIRMNSVNLISHN